MKKILTISLLSAIILFSVTTPAVLAVSPGTIPDAGTIGVGDSDINSVGRVGDLIITIIQWIYTFIFILAVLFILIAAFDFVTSKGNPDKVKAAQDNLKYAGIGIVVALLSYALVAVIRSLISTA